MINKKEILLAIVVTGVGLINPLFGGIFGVVALLALNLDFKYKTNETLGRLDKFKENL